MRRLRMNKPSPHELAPLSVFPSLNKSRELNSCPSRIEHNWNQHPGASLAGSHLPSRSSFLYSSPQSQQSYSHGLSQSQTTEQFSQNSQEDSGTIIDQRYALRGRELALKQHLRLPPCGKQPSLNETSKLAITPSSTAHNLIQRIKSNTWPDYKCQLSEEVEKRFDVMERLMTDICEVLETMERDLTQVKVSTGDTFSEVESSRDKVTRQQDALQSQLKEQEEIMKRLLETITTIPEKVYEDMMKSRMQELENIMKDIPQAIAGQLATLKSELGAAIQTELQKSQKSNDLEGERQQALVTETSQIIINRGKSGKPATIERNLEPQALASLQSSKETFYAMERRHQDYYHVARIHPDASTVVPLGRNLEEKAFAAKYRNSEASTHVDTQRTRELDNLNFLCAPSLASRKIPEDTEGWIEKTTKRSCSVGEAPKREMIHRESFAAQRSRLQHLQTEAAHSNSQAVNADMEEDYSLGFLNTGNKFVGVIAPLVNNVEIPYYYVEDERDDQKIREKMLKARKRSHKSSRKKF